MHLQQLKGLQSSKQYLKGIPFINTMYMIGGIFLSKMVYKRERGQTVGQSLPV